MCSWQVTEQAVASRLAHHKQDCTDQLSALKQHFTHKLDQQDLDAHLRDVSSSVSALKAGIARAGTRQTEEVSRLQTALGHVASACWPVAWLHVTGSRVYAGRCTTALKVQVAWQHQ